MASSVCDWNRKMLNMATTITKKTIRNGLIGRLSGTIGDIMVVGAGEGGIFTGSSGLELESFFEAGICAPHLIQNLASSFNDFPQFGQNIDELPFTEN